MTFPYTTQGTYTYQNYSYDYTDTVYNLMNANEFTVLTYPDGMFWGGISKYDAPYSYPATATYDFDSQTITIKDLYSGISGVTVPRSQISYCYVAANANQGILATRMTNWQLENDVAEMTNQQYATLSNYQAMTQYSVFASKIPLNKIIFCPYVYYFNLSDWNAGTTAITRQQTSIEQWETWENNNETSDKILVGFGIGEYGFIYSNTRVINAGWQSSNFQHFPINSMFGTVINSADSNTLLCGNFNIFVQSSGGNRTKYALERESVNHEDYYYCTWFTNKIYIDSNNLYLPFYNGDVTFDISELLAINTKGTYWRKPYTQGDKYLIGGNTSQEFYWSSVTFMGEIYRVYNSLDDLLRYIASFGMAFCGSMPQRYQHEIAGIIDDLIFAPLLDDNKVYHGEYTRGLANATNPFFTFDDSTDTTYEPTEQGDEPIPTDEEQTDGVDWLPNRSFVVDSMDGLVSMYGLTGQQLARFGQYLWAAFWSDDFLNSIGVIFNENLSLNPSEILNYIVSVRCYPFSLYGRAGASSVPDTIYLGRGEEGIGLNSGSNILKLYSYAEDIDGGLSVWEGGNTIPAYYGDFRDYEPCSRITVFVPFCGSLELPPSQVVGNKIHLRYCVDFSTGAMQATVSIEGKNNYIAGTLIGTIGASVEMTASNLSQVVQKIGGLAAKGATSLALLAIGAKASAAAETAEELTTASGMMLKGGESALSTISSVADMGVVPSASFGTTAGFSSFQITTPMIRVEYRHYELPSNYAHVYGYACNKTVTLSTLEGKGFTVCKNVDLSGIPATQDELTAIESLLTSGVYF